MCVEEDMGLANMNFNQQIS